MQTRRPEIFVSATTGDLRTCRQLIKEALLTLGCVPVEQTNFPPDARTVREMLRGRIAACDAVIHLAGDHYGAEPRERDPADARRSYTQMEYELARELNKPVYVFICGADFPYDPHEPEDDEKRELQRQHRARLQASSHLYTSVASREDLSQRVHMLQTRVEDLAHQLHQSRTWLGRGVAVALILAVLLCGGIALVMHSLRKMQTELDYERAVTDALPANYLQLQSQMGHGMSDEEKQNLAMAEVAKEKGLTIDDVRTAINLFVANVKSNPQFKLNDQALAAFAQSNFIEAAKYAGQAADDFEKQGPAAARDARKARILEGRSLDAAYDFAGAVQAYQKALAITSREDEPQAWAKLTALSGASLNDWAGISTGDDIAPRRKAAIQAEKDALEVFTPKDFPKDWASTQNDLGVALARQAASLSGPDHNLKLEEALAAFREALKVQTQENLPLDWAGTQTNLGNTLAKLAETSIGTERNDMLEQGATAQQKALEVYTEKAFPQDWAKIQGNLGETLRIQATFSSAAERDHLLAEAIDAFQGALKVQTKESLPQEWAKTQTGLGNAFADQAAAASGAAQIELLKKSASAFQNVLEVYSTINSPQDWAVAQYNLGMTLYQQATNSSGTDQSELFRRAEAAFRAALQFQTRETLPREWAEGQHNLGIALDEQAVNSSGIEQINLLKQAVTAQQEALKIQNRKDVPEDWASAQYSLGIALADLAACSSGIKRNELREQSVARYQAAMEIYTLETHPDLNRQIRDAIDRTNTLLK